MYDITKNDSRKEKDYQKLNRNYKDAQDVRNDQQKEIFTRQKVSVKIFGNTAIVTIKNT